MFRTRPQLGRSHRAKIGKDMLAGSIQQTKDVLGIPSDYHVAIVPGSDTGAYELAMWNFLGARPVDVCHWESFGSGFVDDRLCVGCYVRGFLVVNLYARTNALHCSAVCVCACVCIHYA